MNINPTETLEPGCYLDNHRGHYIARDMIELAVGYGFIVGPFARYALLNYERDGHHMDYPTEALFELSDWALDWLNSGQDLCSTCHGRGVEVYDNPQSICKACSGTGRGPREEGQNFPPRLPVGHTWEWQDGDFGIYPTEEE